MIAEVLREVVRAVFGGGADISPANPLPVDASPGSKSIDTIVDDAVLAAATTTTLADCIAAGTHTGVVHLTVMTDAAAHYIVNELRGLTIQNVTDGSTGLITANTATTVTVAALVGGALNQWSPADVYLIAGFSINLSGGPATLALTIRARYNAAATRGIIVHVVSSPDNIAAGIHPGAVDPLVMTDLTAHFVVNELVGLTIQNVTDGSSGVITANTETTVTVAALAGGVTDQWNPNDAYAIAGSNYDTIDWDVWDPAFAADGILRQTKVYETDPVFLKVLIENLDPVVDVDDVQVIATVGA